MRPTGSSRCSPASTARCARSPRACAARRRGSAPGSSRSWSSTLQLYAGRSLDTVTQVETLRPVRSPGLRRLRRCTPRARPCSRPPSGSSTPSRSRRSSSTCCWSPAVRALAERAHPAGLVLDSYLLRALAVAGWAPSFADCARCGAPGPHGAFAAGRAVRCARACRPPGSASPAPETFVLLAALLSGDWAGRGRQRRAAPTRGQRSGGRLQPVPPRARAALAAHGGARMTRSRRTDPVVAAAAAPVRRAAPGDPARVRARARGDRHGRQRPVGQRARSAADGRARRGRGRAAGRGRRRDRDRRHARLGLRVQHRELEALAGRGALPHGLQPRRAAPPTRHHARLGRAGAVGGAAPAAVAVGDRRAGDRRAAHAGQRRVHADDVRQLRRPGRDRRRREGDRAGGRRRAPRPRAGRRADRRPLPRRARPARRGPVPADLGRAADAATS